MIFGYITKRETDTNRQTVNRRINECLIEFNPSSLSLFPLPTTNTTHSKKYRISAGFYFKAYYQYQVSIPIYTTT